MSQQSFQSQETRKCVKINNLHFLEAPRVLHLMSMQGRFWLQDCMLDCNVFQSVILPGVVQRNAHHALSVMRLAPAN